MEEIIVQFMKGGRVVDTERKCTFCRDRGIASNVFCNQCKIDLCTECRKSHTDSDVFRGHKLISFTTKTMCSLHHSHLYTLYCVDCSISLCDQCDASQHLQHRLRKPEDIANERSFILEQAKLRACELSCRLLEHKHEIQDKIVNLTNAFAEAVLRLDTWKDGMTRAINEAYKINTNELDRLRQQQVQELEGYETHISQMALLHQELADFVEHVQSSAPIELAQQQEGIAHMFPVLSISYPQLSVPQAQELRAAELPKFDLTFKTEPMYEFITLSDDDYLEEDNENDPDYENWQIAKSHEDLSRAVAEETPEAEKAPCSRGSPSRAVKRAESSRSRRQLRQLSLDQILQDLTLQNVGCLSLETKVYDIKWHASSEKFIVRTGDPSSPLQCFSPKSQTLEPFSEGPLPQSHIGLCIDQAGMILCTLAPNIIRIFDRLGHHHKDIVLDQVGKIRGIAYCIQAKAYLVTDTQGKNVVMVDAESGRILNRLGGEGQREASFRSPLFLACDNNLSSAGVIVVSDRGNHCVALIDMRGSIKIKFGRYGSTGNRKLKSPAGVWMDPSGAVVVCDWGNKRVVRFGWDGKLETLLNTEQLGGKKPFAVDISPDGTMVVTTWEGLGSNDTIMIFKGYTSSDSI